MEETLIPAIGEWWVHLQTKFPVSIGRLRLTLMSLMMVAEEGPVFLVDDEGPQSGKLFVELLAFRYAMERVNVEDVTSMFS
jgi:hypothetical protein